MTDSAWTTARTLRRIARLAGRDGRVRQRLLMQPATAMDELGVALPDGVTVSVVVDPREHFTVVLPSADDSVSGYSPIWPESNPQVETLARAHLRSGKAGLDRAAEHVTDEAPRERP